MDNSFETNLEKEQANNNIKSIRLLDGKFIIKDSEPFNDLFHLNGEYPVNKLPGVYYKGIQYYDLKDVGYINNSGMINLIDLLKSLLKKGVETQFVNVNEKIKQKIKSLGLDHILNCM